MNPYRGEFEIEWLNGEKRTIVYDWHAIATLRKKFGEDANVIVEKMNSDFDVMADVVMIGLRKYHPEITAKDVMDASPPIIPTVQAVVDSLNIVMGIKGEEGEDDARPPKPPTSIPSRSGGRRRSGTE